MSIAWRGQHQFSLITAVSQPDRETEIGLTHTLRILGVLGVLAVRQIKLLGDFCVSLKKVRSQSA
ncbi:MAG: hypothetical protein V7K77_07200 [Nostoc sp.]|uniref:hypothetical protein n=1 Tax=Nostoc sp. TaxID=1180 RepID=UPI002FF850C2